MWKLSLQASTVQHQSQKARLHEKCLSTPSPGRMSRSRRGKNTRREHQRSVRFPKDMSPSKCTTHPVMKGISLSVEVHVLINGENHRPVKLEHPVYRSTVQTVVKETMENATKPNRSLPMNRGRGTGGALGHGAPPLS